MNTHYWITRCTLHIHRVDGEGFLCSKLGLRAALLHALKSEQVSCHALKSDFKNF